MIRPLAPRGRVLARVSVLGAILVLCVMLVDRPASSWAASHLHPYRAWFDAPTHLVDPLLPIASVGLMIGAIRTAAGDPLGPRGRVFVAACLAVAVAVLVKEQAKYVCGRLWPETWVENNPSWIGTRSYGFSPFHGGRGWASFPSGHMTVISAPAAVIWETAPVARPVAAVACAAVAIGLFGADYHFVADLIAGTALGIACGLGVLALSLPTRPSPATGGSA